jgi:Bacterial regulatory proteins, luxR family/Putative MetA-pathway of phenol degradation
MTMPKASTVDSNRAHGSGGAPDFNAASLIGRRLRHASASVALFWPALAPAQEMEPRAYSAIPVGTNFIVSDYARSSGGYSVDPSLPIANVQAKINTWSLGYSHSFGVAGHTASVAVSMPYANANVKGDVEGMPEQVSRSGLGDVRFRGTVNLLGDPALTPEEFARRSPSTVMGAALTVVAPTGQYVPSRWDVARGIARGLSRKQIARELNVTEGHVRQVSCVIYDKLQVRNRVEAALKVNAELAGGSGPDKRPS